MTQIEHTTREAVAKFLPDAIAAALMSYSDFLEEAATNSDEQDPKEFKAHHDACKMAIAHIQLLIKLAEWADLSNPDGGGDLDMMALMSQALEKAQEEVRGFEE